MSALFSNTSEADLAPPEVADDNGIPRIVSRSAIMSVILGVLGLAGLVFPSLLALAFAGLGLAILGLLTIRKFPREYSGGPVAILGIVLCGGIAVGGTTWHVVDYATEVPEGFQRISFYTLNPDDPKAPAIPPPRAIDLDGKPVFIKGYVYPDNQRGGLKQFVLIPDLGTCCFGGQPKLTDMVLVTLRDPHRTVYNQRKRKLTGILKVDTALKEVSGVTGVYYQLDAESIQ